VLRKHRKLAAIAFSTALLLGIAAFLRIPGPDANEVCDAYLSNDRARFRLVVGRLRYSDMTPFERVREAMTPFPPSVDCLAREFRGRSELMRFCRGTLPTTRAEHAVRELRFKKAFLESQIECLSQLRRERLQGAPAPG
jgi:hypothetical protein